METLSRGKSEVALTAGSHLGDGKKVLSQVTPRPGTFPTFTGSVWSQPFSVISKEADDIKGSRWYQRKPVISLITVNMKVKKWPTNAVIQPSHLLVDMRCERDLLILVVHSMYTECQSLVQHMVALQESTSHKILHVRFIGKWTYNTVCFIAAEQNFFNAG